MSTEIRSASGGGDRLEIGRLGLPLTGDPRMYVRAMDRDGREWALINLPRADFLAAVAAECGVIVIDRAELPPVEPIAGTTQVMASRGDRGRAVATQGEDTAELLRGFARAYLALAEYLDAHPPVDEALVDDLATAAYSHLPAPVKFDRPDAVRYIRALIKSGRIEVKP